MIDPNLIIGAGKEFAGVLREALKAHNDNRYDKLREFIKKVESEKARPDRDHDDILVWNGVIKLFSRTVIEEVSTKS